MLFIIQHQISELWMKLMIHELSAAIGHVARRPARAALQDPRARQADPAQLFEQWAVLETLTPSEYDAVPRRRSAQPSGFQSAQYRAIEFLLGNKHAAMLDVFRHDPRACRAARGAAARAVAVRRVPAPPRAARPAGAGRRASSATGRRAARAQRRRWSPVFAAIYERSRGAGGTRTSMCEKLVDVEESFQLWRFRHMKTVERIIGYKRGTGGSSGVGFLRSALDHTFFPELIDVRTVIGAGA